jgi:hypothetical protein
LIRLENRNKTHQDDLERQENILSIGAQCFERKNRSYADRLAQGRGSRPRRGKEKHGLCNVGGEKHHSGRHDHDVFGLAFSQVLRNAQVCAYGAGKDEHDLDSVEQPAFQ